MSEPGNLDSSRPVGHTIPAAPAPAPAEPPGPPDDGQDTEVGAAERSPRPIHWTDATWAGHDLVNHPAGVVQLGPPAEFRLLQSPTIGQVSWALAQAQGKFKPVTKDRENDFLKTRYATLDAVLEAVRAALAEHDLALIGQTLLREGKPMVLYTRLIHKSGEWLGCTYEIKPVQNSPQGEGSALTYARRYSESALLNVAPDQDDDGQAASTPAAAEQQRAGGRQQQRRQQAPAGDEPVVAGGIGDPGLASELGEKLQKADTRPKLAAIATEIASATTLNRDQRSALRALYEARLEKVGQPATPAPGAAASTPAAAPAAKPATGEGKPQ